MSKSLALTVICKNEEKHIERFLRSFLPVVDHVYLTDTGSTDKTVEIAQKIAGDKITVKHFKWIQDFSAARNFCAEGVKEDYILWADLDDELSDAAAFMAWRQNLMGSADMWLATYNYALNQEGKPVISFARERVYKNEPRFAWKYFLHEGVNCAQSFNAQFASTWAINHLRTPEDLEKDKGRNLQVFEHHLAESSEIDARMQYYYGKELFEAGKQDEALKSLLKANSNPALEIHDRTLAIQYACFILLNKKEYIQCINLAMSGLLIAPQRAEFFVCIGDCYLQMGQMREAHPWFEAAKKCVASPDKGFTGFIYQNKEAYGVYPMNQIARIYAHLGEFDLAIKEALDAFEKFKSPESEIIAIECEKAKVMSRGYKVAPACDDIVFTCPGGLYEWDERIYREKGIGGSETAAVEMAANLKKLTNRRVIVFNERAKEFVAESGVIYKPVSEVAEYFYKNKPALHIASRHNFKFTNAKTLAWSHDIIIPGAETNPENYDHFLALSNYHAGFVTNVVGVPKDKVVVTRNGIDPSKFEPMLKKLKKNPLKIIYVSSPDRGLERAIGVCEVVRTHYPVELHVFYGLENLKKLGKHQDVARYEAIMNQPWIHYHGNVKQADLSKHYEDAAIWLYPTNFTETFCISALETVLCGVYPVVRNYGALPDTLSGIPSTIVDRDCEKLEDYIYWGERVCETIKLELWNTIDVDTRRALLKERSWESLAKDWAKQFLGLGGI